MMECNWNKTVYEYDACFMQYENALSAEIYSYLISVLYIIERLNWSQVYLPTKNNSWLAIEINGENEKWTRTETATITTITNTDREREREKKPLNIFIEERMGLTHE